MGLRPRTSGANRCCVIRPAASVPACSPVTIRCQIPARCQRQNGAYTACLDYCEQRKHQEAFRVFPEVREMVDKSDQAAEQRRLSTYRTEVTVVGWTFDKLCQKINVTQERPRLSFVKEQHQFAPLLEGTWRLLSGFERGLGWALLSGTDRRVEAEIPGGLALDLVINDDAFVNAAKSTCFLLLSACRLFTRRLSHDGHRTGQRQPIPYAHGQCHKKRIV